MKKIIAILLLVSNALNAATLTVDTGTYGFTGNAIRQAVISAAAGDRINIPAGLFSCTTNILVDKAIRFVGAGTNATVISDDQVNRSMVAGTFYVLNYLDKTNLFSFEDMTLTSSNTLAVVSNPFMRLDFGSPMFMMKNCYFSNYAARVVYDYDLSSNRFDGRVWSKCAFYNPRNAGGFFFDEDQSAGHGDNGYYSFGHPIQWGTTNQAVIESCYVSNGISRAFTDGRGGRHFTVRSNSLIRVSVENHELLGKGMGPSGYESYYNSFTNDVSSESAHLLRGGTAAIWNNDTRGNYPGLLRIVYYRSLCEAPGPPFTAGNPFGSTTWRGAIGTNIWDHNDPATFATLTNNAPDPASWSWTNKNGSSYYALDLSKWRMVEDTNASWTVNQWGGYSLINLTTGYGGLIWTNSATKLWMFDPGAGGTTSNSDMCFVTNGHRFEIHKLIQPLQVPGTHLGDQLCCGSDSVMATPSGWPHEQYEPIALWGNTGTTSVSPSFYTSFILEGQNWTNAVKSGYTPLGAHPLSSGNTNPPPTIASISNQTIAQDNHTGSLAVTLGSGLTNVANYTVATASSLTELLPNSGTNYVFGGSGASRTLVVYPVAGQYGATTVTLTVTDEASSQTATAFLLTVTQSGAAVPTITAIANVSTTVGHNVTTATFTVGDPVTDPINLVVTAASSDQNRLPDSHLMVNGTGAIRTVTGSPTQEGPVTITVTARNDAFLTDSTAFTITASGNSITLGPRNLKARGVFKQ